MDNLVKVQWFGIIWYEEWLPKKSQLSCKYFCGYTLLFFYDFLMYSLIFMNMQICSLAYFTATWNCYVLHLFILSS